MEIPDVIEEPEFSMVRVSEGFSICGVPAREGRALASDESERSEVSPGPIPEAAGEPLGT